MTAKCKINVIERIADAKLRQHVREHVHLAEVALTVGRSYPVLGLVFYAGIPWYLICESCDDDFPKTHCSALFELEDSRVPEGWQLRPCMSNVGSNAILPREWACDSRFLEKLVDGDSEALRVFGEIKRRYGVLGPL